MIKVNVQEAAKIIKEGGVVAIPTETVYGLAVDGLNPEAVKKVYQIKGRPVKNPLILHISDSSELWLPLVSSCSDKTLLLMEKFWPGPLTLLLDKDKSVPDEVTGDLATVCLREPKNELTRQLIDKVGKPLAAPSANKSGRPSPTSPEMVAKDFPEVPILDGGECQLGLESTVVDARAEVVKVLRLGALPVELIEEVLGEKVIVVDKDGKNDAPGKAFKHYSPKGEVILVWPWESFGEKYSQKMSSEYSSVEEAVADLYDRYKCGIITTEKWAKLFFGYEVISLGVSAEDWARNLFKSLHQTEDLGWEKIIVDMSEIDFEQGARYGLEATIIERLKRSAEK